MTRETRGSSSATTAEPVKRKRSSSPDAQEKRQKRDGLVLDKNVRAALATVISQMAVDLPSPLDGILSLWLPPAFTKTEENTLGYVLGQDSLTWESLVTTLHIFCENLLVPCSYPNPMPPLALFHQPLPPLPSHFRPHVIYNFCASLYTLMLQIEPKWSLDEKTAERWALVQRLPSSLQSNTSAGEWFTSSADMREDKSLEALAVANKLGLASAVALQTMGNSKRVVSLNEALVRKASLKMNRWKELRAARGRGGFGSILRGVTATSTSWTPSFAPTFDSSRGGSYPATLAAMERRTHAMTPPPVAEGNDLLSQNHDLINELAACQSLRLEEGNAEPTEHEQAIADVLLKQLTRLASTITPTDLAPSVSHVGSAYNLSTRFLPISGPSIRGTLDPRRPRAIHDNLTIRPRPQTSAPRNYSSGPVSQAPPYRYQPSAVPSPTGTYRQNTANVVTPARPGPGPSALRQSFGPSPYGNPAAGLMSQVGPGY